MSQNAEIVRTGVDALNRRDLTAVRELCDEDFEFVSFFTAVDAQGATYRGQDAWASYINRMDEAWETWQVEGLQVFDAPDDRVVSVFRLVATGKGSGARVEREAGAMYEFRDGRMWRMHSFLDPAEAFEAAGLKE